MLNYCTAFYYYKVDDQFTKNINKLNKNVLTTRFYRKKIYPGYQNSTKLDNREVKKVRGNDRV